MIRFFARLGFIMWELSKMWDYPQSSSTIHPVWFESLHEFLSHLILMWWASGVYIEKGRKLGNWRAFS